MIRKLLISKGAIINAKNIIYQFRGKSFLIKIVIEIKERNFKKKDISEILFLFSTCQKNQLIQRNRNESKN